MTEWKKMSEQVKAKKEENFFTWKL